jgi:hypothetical protein
MALLFEDPSDDNRKGRSNYWIFEECREPTDFERVTRPNLPGTNCDVVAWYRDVSGGHNSIAYRPGTQFGYGGL